MDLDGLLALIYLLLRWKVVLCLGGSTLLAIVLAKTFPWLATPQAIVIALLGCLAGAMWETTSKADSSKVANTSETSPSAAGGAAFFVGAIWGACSANSTHSFLAGAVVFAMGAWGWAWYADSLKPPVARGRVFFCIALAALSYSITAMAFSIAH